MDLESKLPARLIRQARERAGMSQAELAARAGTSQPTISAYEAGRKVPSAVTLVRLVRAAGGELTTTFPDDVRAWLAAGDRLRQLPAGGFAAAAGRVRGGEDALFVFRELLDEVYLWEQVRGRDALVGLMAEPPSPTGDLAADALFAGLAEHLALTRGIQRPRWVCEPARFLDRWWFPHSRRGFDAPWPCGTPPQPSDDAAS